MNPRAFNEITEPPIPPNLKASGKRFWLQTADNYVLRVDQWVLLKQVCRQIDLIDQLQGEIDHMIESEEFIVRGSMNQDVANPLMGEIRSQRLALATMLKQMNLPPEPTKNVKGEEGGEPKQGRFGLRLAQ